MRALAELLVAAAAAAEGPGDEEAPAELVAAVAAVPNAFAAMNDPEHRDELLGALSDSVGRVAMSAREGARGESPSPRLVCLLRWLARTLGSWTAEADPLRRGLVVALLTLGCFGKEGELWRALPTSIGKNHGLLDELAAELASLKIEYTPLDAPYLPIWEGEFAQGFIRADEAGDWVQIAATWPRMEAASRPSILVTTSARLLARYDLRRMAVGVANLRQTATAMQVLGAVSTPERLALALLTDNPWVQFAAVFLSFRAGWDDLELSEEVQAKSTDLLCRVGADAGRWRAWMTVLGRHPPHYARLQVPLGRALARLPADRRLAYVETLTLSRCRAPSDDSREAVARCLAAFGGAADPEVRSELWTAAHQRWSAWRFDAGDPEAHLSDLCWSCLDYAVAAYALEYMSDTDRRETSVALFARLGTVKNEWHASQSSWVSEWFRLQSQLQPYAHADAVAAGTKRLEDRSVMYVPAGIQASKYIECMFRWSTG